MATLHGHRRDAPTAGALVTFTSDLPLRSRRHAAGFLLDALRTRRLLERMLRDPESGLVSYELRAHPLSNRYSTASTWESEQHLRRFATHPTHVAVMRRQRGRLGPTTLRTEIVDATERLVPGSANASRVS